MIGVSILAGKLSAIATKCWSNYAEEATFGNRLFRHFGFIGMDKERSVDIRMNNQQNLVRAYWSTNSTFGVNGPIGRQAQGKMGIYASLGVCITTLITGSIYVFTCLKAWGGAFDVGSITQYVGAATAMVANVFSLTGLLGTLETNTGYLDKTFEFLDIPNAMYQGSLTTEKRSDRRYEVEFKDVSFKYPGSDIWALRHVNMKFKVGKRLAVVGENGSGKTTLLKLLCGDLSAVSGTLDRIDFSTVYLDQEYSLIHNEYSILEQAEYFNRRHLPEHELKTILNRYLFPAATWNKSCRLLSGGEKMRLSFCCLMIADNTPDVFDMFILDEPTNNLDIESIEIITATIRDYTGTVIAISHDKEFLKEINCNLLVNLVIETR